VRDCTVVEGAGAGAPVATAEGSSTVLVTTVAGAGSDSVAGGFAAPPLGDGAGAGSAADTRPASLGAACGAVTKTLV